MADIEQILKDHIKVEVKAESDKNIETIRATVLSKVLEEVKAVRPIQVISLDGKKSDSQGLSHEMTEEVLNYLSVRIPLLLVGPAGSGKTHIAINCAKLLGLDFFSISVNEQTSKSDFLGYNDANGKLVKTNFRKAYEKGGVFIIDEIDAGNPNILTVVNSALSNETCPFPDGMITRHKDFVAVCTANTFGEGESLQYIGRNILDAATKDRFASLYIDYSETLELALVPSFKNMLKELRAHFKKNNTLMVVSTRAGIRLESLFVAKGGKVTKNDIVNCMNLQQEITRDSMVVKLVEKYATA
jgi:MoxR-like ATPase